MKPQTRPYFVLFKAAAGPFKQNDGLFPKGPLSVIPLDRCAPLKVPPRAMATFGHMT